MKGQLFIWILILFFLTGFNELDSHQAFPFTFNYKVRKVVIDPGHGGKDPGTHGKHTEEKDIALAISLKVGQYIEKHLPDVEVIYTRKKDHFIGLDERARLANKNNADLFISIHCNAQAKGNVAKGTETYVMGVHKNEDNLSIAKRENASILMEEDYESTYDGFNPNSPISNIIFTQYQNAYLEQSILFAKIVEDQFKYRAKRKSRGVKQAGFLVLYKTAMPSVLVETGYLTNLSEESYLNTDDGQSYIASAVYRAFKKYKENVEGQVGTDLNLEEVYVNPSNGSNSEEAGSESSEYIDSSSDEVKSGQTTYRIQLYTSYEAFDIGEAKFDQVSSVEIESDLRGIKSYLLVDEFTSQWRANQELARLKKAGFKYAKVVAYKDDERL